MKNLAFIIFITVSSIYSHAQQIIGDIKPSFRTSDHNGWYLLNGRAVSSLPPAAQTAANGLGINSSLPNANGRYLKGKSTTQTLGAPYGANSVTLNQANLPDFIFTPSSSTSQPAGQHSHTVTDYTPVYPGTEVGYQSGGNKTEPGEPLSREVTTDLSGDHNHNITLNMNPNGTTTSISIEPSYITTNSFIYLGE